MKTLRLLLICFLYISSYSQTTLTFTASGSFTVPCGVTSITVECWGAGGGGGGGGGGNGDGGGGGGGGAYTKSISISVTPLGTYNYTVGLGGNAGASNSIGSLGGQSIAVFGSTTIISNGGNPGAGYGTSGGAGGTGGSGGTYAGGNGGNGTGSSSGGGGEGASSNTVGVNASANTAGTSTNDGGDGAAGILTNGDPGLIGNAPGGGGSGGTRGSAGGKGGRGEIRITYATPPTANAGSDQTITGCVTTATLAGNSVSGYTGAWTCVSNCGSSIITNSTSATSSISGLTLGTSTAFQWVLTHTASGCSLSADNVTITPTAGSCPPSNDEPTGATPITAGASCSYTTFTNANATASSCSTTIPAPGCASYSGGDVWFSVTVPTSGAITFSTQSGIITDGGMAIYSGTPCGALSLITCSDDVVGNMPAIALTGQTAGSTLYIRFWEYSNDNNGTFGLCATAIIPPANDNCTGAFSVSVNSNTLCASTTTGTTTNASQSLAGCAGNADDDVWFSFTAAATTQSITTTPGTLNNIVFEVFSGTCGALTSYSCVNNTTGASAESSSISGLSIGTTYFVRVYSNGNNTNVGTFSVCINAPPPAPTNDDCPGATSLTVNSGSVCTTSSGGTLVGATTSTLTNSCGGGVADDDVWYKFTAAATSHSISITNVSGSLDMYHSVYAGTCGSIGAPLICSDPNLSFVSGLTIGNVYYVRVYSYTGTAGQTATFSVCVITPPPPPANDDCSGATTITANSGTNCASPTGGTVLGATASTQSNTCLGNADDDVWYSFTATSTSHSITISNIAGSVTNLNHSVYGGTCGSIGAPLICSDPNSSIIFGLTVNSVYYIRVYTSTSTAGQTTTFSVCVTTPPPPPANDDCSGATTLAISSGTACTTLTGGTLLGATPSSQTDACGGGLADDDVWYKFTATTTSHSVSISNVAGSVTDMYHSIYNGTCGSIGSPIICNNANGSLLSGLTIGSVYYVRIYSYSSTWGQTTTFSVCVNTPPDPCATITNIASCGTSVSTTILAGDGVYGSSACGFTTGGNEKIFSFTPSASGTYSIQQGSSFTYIDYQIKQASGGCGNSGWTCIDDLSGASTSPAFTMSAGVQYYFLLDPENNAGGSVTFTLVCPPTPPANDNCSAATTVAVSSGTTCSTLTGGTLLGATSSTITNTCGGNADDDVWYSFTATATTHSVTVSNVSGSQDMYHSLYAGTCSSIGVPIMCSDPNNSVITGLSIGSVYYIRIYSSGSTLNLSTTFSLCVTTPTVPPAPANDNCPGAYPVTVNSGTTCTSLTGGTLYGATASTQTNSCGGTIDDDDVWYSFVATSTYHKITLNNVAGSPTDLYHSVYSGTCGSIGNAIICSDLNTSGVNGLIVGNTYYVRVYSSGTAWGATTTFSVCITTPPTPPLNTSCSGMTPICSGSSITFEAQSSGGTATPGPDYDCLTTQPNPTWFYMEILTPGTMAIDMSAGSDIDFALWGPYPNLGSAQADCSTYPTPIDCSYSTSNTEQANIASVLEGEVYALLVTNYADIVQNITLNQATGASATTNCSIILPINLLYFNATINESKNIDLNWATESEQNNSHFDIEKSTNGVTWGKIASIQGKGNSYVRSLYHHTDNKPNNGLQYYRLKQFDFDGTYKYSQIVSVDLSETKEQIINVHPNPTNDIINYDIITNNNSLIYIELVSYTGLSVLEQSKIIEQGKNSFDLNLSELPSGVYLLKVKFESTGETVIQKIIKN